jgi:hypothetical protein
VSGECELDFDLGLRSNLDSTRALLDALRSRTQNGAAPTRVVFSSSVAVFGPDEAVPMPAIVTDVTLPTPQTSYGVQKHICEHLVADYTRKGFIDGRSARLMTVTVRPGRPNGAAAAGTDSNPGTTSGPGADSILGRRQGCCFDNQNSAAAATAAAVATARPPFASRRAAPLCTSLLGQGLIPQPPLGRGHAAPRELCTRGSGWHHRLGRPRSRAEDPRADPNLEQIQISEVISEDPRAMRYPRADLHLARSHRRRRCLHAAASEAAL